MILLNLEFRKPESGDSRLVTGCNKRQALGNNAKSIRLLQVKRATTTVASCKQLPGLFKIVIYVIKSTFFLLFLYTIYPVVEPSHIHSSDMPSKRLVVFCDGTWVSRPLIEIWTRFLLCRLAVRLRSPTLPQAPSANLPTRSGSSTSPSPLLKMLPSSTPSYLTIPMSRLGTKKVSV